MKRKTVFKLIKFLLIIIILITAFILYSRYLGTKGFKVKEYSIVDSNIPEEFYGFKIVHISDIHYKSITTKEDLKNIVKNINALKPDIVIFTGDLFDKDITYEAKDYEDLTNILNSIDYNVGKYAIKGEHDIDSHFESILNDSNFTNLNDTYDVIYTNGINPILLVGISSNYENNHIKEIISNIDLNYQYKILMLHEPDFINEIDHNNFNLILAGHSHSRQIKLPLIENLFINKYSNNYYNNYYNLGNTNLYISSGVGTNKYKFRFLNKPSINFYRLRNK